MDIRELAERHNGYIVESRRWFHAHPELSFEEKETTARIKQELELMGIETQTFPDYNGVIGTIHGGRGGAVVMLRADIDALPTEEQTGLPFVSQNKGKMHACGHDAHIAMLLGAAKILSEMKEDLPGTVKLLFQAAEESCHGAEYYVQQGCLGGVDAIFGMHIWGTLEAPLMNLEAGGRMASCDNFSITVKGLTSHGSAPHLGHDAVVAAASIIMNLQTFVSRVNDPLNTLVVTVGKVRAGSRFNIIANEAVLEGTVRTYSRELRKTIDAGLEKIIKNTAEALGCSADFRYDRFPGPIINDSGELNRIAKNAAVKLYGEETLTTMPKLTGSEDFAYFMEKVPGFYGFIGALKPAAGITYSNHSDKFTVDEDALHRGAALYAQFAKDFLDERSRG